MHVVGCIFIGIDSVRRRWCAIECAIDNIILVCECSLLMRKASHFELHPFYHACLGAQSAHPTLSHRHGPCLILQSESWTRYRFSSHAMSSSTEETRLMASPVEVIPPPSLLSTL